MKIQFMSDIHREHGGPDINVFGEEFSPAGEVLVLAGDLSTAYGHHNIVKEFGNKGVPVVAVLGNHDYYGGTWIEQPKIFKKIAQELCSDFHVLENDYVKIGDVYFIGSTYWSNINYIEEAAIYFGVPDFQLLRSGAERIQGITIEKVRGHHYNSYNYIRLIISQIRASDENAKIVVVTHFPPSYKAQEERFKRSKGGGISSYFYSNEDEIIIETQPDVWIYGHTHGRPEWTEGKTRVLTNQYGYLNLAVDLKFNRDRIIEV